MVTYARMRAARERLSRFKPHHYTDLLIFPDQAVTAVTDGMESRYLTSEPSTDEDIADAALLLDEAREQTMSRLDHQELTILDGLQVLGWTNQKIGEHLGYDKRTAAAQVGGRIKRLRKRLPSFERPERKPAAGTTT